MSFWKNNRFLVTGGAGFLGSYVVKKLRERGCVNLFVPRSRDYDLVKMDDVLRLYQDAKPDIVVHLAARVGGIGANQATPGSFFYDNLMMGTQLMEVGRKTGLKKFVTIGTICAYPKYTPAPFKEEDLWNGYPEETNAPYGLAKKILLVQSQAYRQQYGFKAIYLLPVNLYGPGDNFDSETSHVIPAIIRKCLEAIEQEKKEIICWGDGTPTREFLYVEECAEAILLATERYEGANPINIGTGIKISIKALVELITDLTGFRGKIVWDTTRPNGQPSRCLDVSLAKKEFGFLALKNLREGLLETIHWYRSHPSHVDLPHAPAHF